MGGVRGAWPLLLRGRLSGHCKATPRFPPKREIGVVFLTGEKLYKEAESPYVYAVMANPNPNPNANASSRGSGGIIIEAREEEGKIVRKAEELHAAYRKEECELDRLDRWVKGRGFASGLQGWEKRMELRSVRSEALGDFGAWRSKRGTSTSRGSDVDMDMELFLEVYEYGEGPPGSDSEEEEEEFSDY